MTDSNDVIAMLEIHRGTLDKIQKRDCDSLFSKGNEFSATLIPTDLPVFPAVPVARQPVTHAALVYWNENSG